MIILRAGERYPRGQIAGWVFENYKDFVAKIRTKLPETTIVYFSLCPARGTLEEREANKRLNLTHRGIHQAGKDGGPEICRGIRPYDHARWPGARRAFRRRPASSQRGRLQADGRSHLAGASQGPVDEAKVLSAKGSIHTLETAIDVFEIDAGRYPTVAEGLNPLVAKPAEAKNWRGPYEPRPDRSVETVSVPLPRRAKSQRIRHVDPTARMENPGVGDDIG